MQELDLSSLTQFINEYCTYNITFHQVISYRVLEITRILLKITKTAFHYQIVQTLASVLQDIGELVCKIF